MKIQCVGGFLDGEWLEYSEPVPNRVELWPQGEAQRQKSYATAPYCTPRDSQIYDLDDGQEPPVYRVKMPWK